MSMVPSERGAPAPIAENESSAAQYETHTAVAVLCSELAHEVAPTLAFLRDLVRSKLLAAVEHSIAEEEVARLEGVVGSLRRTKRSEEATVPVELATVAARAAKRAGEGIRGGTRVVLEVPRGLRVLACERGLELMLVSLLRNALRAARRGAVEMRARLEGDSWCLEVEDDGQGLPDELCDRLFMPLSTLGASGRGTGIPTVLRMARDHGWEVGHARRGEHTFFTVQFNRADMRTEG